MKKLNKKKILKFVRENKVKVALGGLGGLLILFLVVVGLLTIFVKPQPQGVAYLRENGMEEEMMDYDSLAPMAVSKASRGSSFRTMPIPVEEFGEGKYRSTEERKLIKNGNLSLIVKNVDEFQRKAKNIVESRGGFIAKENFSENKKISRYDRGRRVDLATSSKSGYMEVKVPNKNFDETFYSLKEISLKVNNESVSVRDVTEQYADLKTQLKNKKAEVEQYRKILAKAEKIEDILKVTQYLNTAQTQFERLQGRMNLLSNQIALSTIRINIVSEESVKVFGVTWSPLAEIKKDFAIMLNDLKDFSNDVIAFVFKLPIYILYIGGFILVLRIIWKLFLKLKSRVWEKKKKK